MTPEVCVRCGLLGHSICARLTPGAPFLVLHAPKEDDGEVSPSDQPTEGSDVLVSESTTKKRYTFAVDWDGTCVENAWPAMGAWLPGAIDALRHLDSIGTVVIHTCRVAPVDIDGKTWRSKSDVQESVQEILDVLDSVGLGHLEVWTEPWKPSALVYIDDRAMRFEGNWHELLFEIEELVERGVDYSIGGITEGDGPTRARCDVVGDRTCECPLGPCPLGFDPDIDDVEFAVEADPRIEFVSQAKDFVPDPDVLALIRGDPLYQKVSEASHAGAKEMLEFTTGATRNKKEDEVQYEGFLSPLALRAFGEYMHKHRFTADGDVRSSDNWQKGIPLDSYIDSLWRHVMDLWLIHRGYGSLARESLDEALAGAFFNIQGYMHETAKERLEEVV